ncbi:hypothetical protein CDAR_471191 [Caerostris darwini]|uniref:Uncharacterized protein n=1 Tax=Caerostris darwini TaxID=1538125 RepID=A0AAV4QMS1_9ARAC|nr:hypothetical protein CDAR_471191 [Caerostris darwini]
MNLKNVIQTLREGELISETICQTFVLEERESIAQSDSASLQTGEILRSSIVSDLIPGRRHESPADGNLLDSQSASLDHAISATEISPNPEGTVGLSVKAMGH